jgi:hypothetical protein
MYLNNRLLVIYTVVFCLFFCVSCSKKTTNIFHTPEYLNNLDINAIPNLKGNGSNSIGGRGGIIYKVTNLNDNGQGSLRHGIENIDEPRNIVFEVSGDIILKSTIKVHHPFLSIYGQTAPGHINITGAGISISSHNIIIQHISVRPGDSLSGQSPYTRDGIVILGNENIRPHDIVIDHCSITHSIDENFSLWGGVEDIAISNCIIGLGLHHSLHSKGPHSKGMLIGANSKRITIYRNIFAFNDERNPRITGDTEIVFSENLIVGCTRGTQILDIRKAGEMDISLLNNIYQPANKISVIIKKVSSSSRIELFGNNIDEKKQQRLSQGARRSSIELHDKEILKASLLSGAGSRPKARHKVDANIITNIIDENYVIYDCTSEQIDVAEGSIVKTGSSSYRMKLQGLDGINDSNIKRLHIRIGNQFHEIKNVKFTKKPYRKIEFNLNRNISASFASVFMKCEKFLPIFSTERKNLSFPDVSNHNKDFDNNGYSDLEDFIYSEFVIE